MSQIVSQAQLRKSALNTKVVSKVTVHQKDVYNQLKKMVQQDQDHIVKNINIKLYQKSVAYKNVVEIIKLKNLPKIIWNNV